MGPPAQMNSAATPFEAIQPEEYVQHLVWEMALNRPEWSRTTFPIFGLLIQKSFLESTLQIQALESPFGVQNRSVKEKRNGHGNLNKRLSGFSAHSGHDTPINEEKINEQTTASKPFP